MSRKRAINHIAYKGTKKPSEVKTLARWRNMVKRIHREDKINC